MANIRTNTTDLQTILNTVKSLPSANENLESLAGTTIVPSADISFVDSDYGTSFFVQGDSTAAGELAVGDRVTVGINPNKFGDAKQSDVADGVYFTSENGLKLRGTHVCSSGSGSSGGYVMKTGTVTDSTTIDTGLSSVKQFVLYKASIAAVGLAQAVYNSDVGTTFTYCSYYSAYAKTINMSSGYTPTVSGGTVTWNNNDSTNMTAGVEYTWIAFGTE